MTEKKVLYIAIGFLQAFLGQTWVQSLYNDPSFVHSRSVGEWVVITALTLLNSALAALIVWKSYTSTPEAMPPTEPPKP